MFNKKNILQYAKLETHLPNITPTRLHVPQWWKDADLWVGGKMEVDQFKSNPALKACVPFLDSLQVGYVITLHTDMLVTQDEFGDPVIKWLMSPDPVTIRDHTKNPTIPVPNGYLHHNYVWRSPYFIKTPKGYSSIICHPLNRNDLPFLTLDAVVDTDTVMYNGHIPFFLKKGFTGEIKRGTPIIMIFPFKRENWSIEENNSLIKEGGILEKISRSVFSGNYKHNIWKKKVYE